MINLIPKSKTVSRIFPLLLVAVTTLVALFNYTPGTWLTGWDTLHPELNFPLNLQRVLFGVWREDQGLGAVAAHAHMAELPRILVLWLFSLALPLSFVRYAYVFLCLILGPLGIYLFLRRTVVRSHALAGQVAAFLGGLFYLFNLGTVQHFFVPFEMFPVQFAALGWLFLFATNALEKGRTRDWLALALASFLAAPMAYAFLLWYAYALGLAMYLGVLVLRNKSRKRIKRAVAVIGLTIAMNAFWLLPNWYFLATQASQVPQAKINQLFSPEAFLHNKEYGTLVNAAVFKNFLFNWVQFTDEGKFQPLLLVWKDHLANPVIAAIGLTGFLAVMGGIGIGLRSKNKRASALLPGFLMSLLMIISMNPPFEPIYTLVRDHLELFAEAFRFPYTKFSIILMFTSTVYFSIFLEWAFRLLAKRGKKERLFALAGSAVIGSALVFYSWPMFTGNLINKRMRISIPEPYFSLFEWINAEEKGGRVAPLPIHSMWGWEYHDWGYEGAGFIWFGIKHPVLARDFDRWNPDNQQYYMRMSRAVYTQDASALHRTADAYNIRWFLIDRSVIVPTQDTEILRFSQIETLLSEAGATKAWENGFLSVYEFDQRQSGALAYAPEQFVFASGETDYAREDIVFANLGTYVSLEESTGGSLPASAIYPFADLSREEIDAVQITNEEGQSATLQMHRRLPKESEDYDLIVPPIPPETKYIAPALASLDGRTLRIAIGQALTIASDGNQLQLTSLPELFIRLNREYTELIVLIGGQETLLVQGETKRIPAVTLDPGEPFDVALFDPAKKTQILLKEQFEARKIQECWTREGEEGIVEAKRSEGALEIKVQDAAGCFSLQLDQPKGEELVKVALPFRSEDGARPHVCLVQDGKTYAGDSCEHEGVFYHTQASETWAVVERTALVNRGAAYWLDIAARPPAQTGRQWTIWYKTPQVQRIPLVGRHRFEKTVWSKLGQTQRLPIAGGKEFTISVHSNRIPITLAGGRAKADNCDIFDRGWGEKQTQENAVRYTAGEGGASCDFFVLDHVSTLETYILELMGSGASGRGTKLYLFNRASGRADIETLLPDKAYNQRFVLLSQPAGEDLGYTLNIETRSFGSGVSENELNQAAAYTFPLDWLTGIHAEPASTPEKMSPLRNQTAVINGKNPYIGFYSFQVNVKEEPGLLVLPQAYDSAWHAYEKFAPWNSGKKLEHVQVNGWANGWILPQGEYRISIVFLPQYLELGGLLFVPMVALALVKRPGRAFPRLGKTSYTKRAQTLWNPDSQDWHPKKEN